MFASRFFRAVASRGVPVVSRKISPKLVAGVGIGSGLATLIAPSFSPLIAEQQPCDYQKVAAAIADILDKEDYDDGSIGPVLVRLAWHLSGTYDVKDGSGGSDGATMRFSPESDHGANAGLEHARAFLEPIKAKFPAISYADLYTLAGAVAIQEMGGPDCVGMWTPGRKDAPNGDSCTPDGRLPDAAQGAKHLRDIFYRQGFNDQEIVALAGAHSMGRCHKDRSGFEGPWTNAPTTFSNLFFQELLKGYWEEKKWSGPRQFTDPTGTLMMLPSDISLVQDPAFKKWVEIYAADDERFSKDFAKAWKKLTENGVKWPAGKSESKYQGLLLTGLLALAAYAGKGQ